VEEELEINYRELAIVNAGLDQTICETQTEVQLFGDVDGDGYAGEWTTNAFGDFTPDATQLDAVYIPGANDILIGSASLVLNSTNNGPCPAQTDTVVITINPLPTVDAGEDDFVCSSTGSISLNGSVENAESIEWDSDGDGIFLPSENEIDPDYIFGNVDVANGGVDLILTALPLEGCEEVSDTVSITLNTPLEADFSFTPACVGSPVQFTDQTKVLAGSIASWSWNFGNGNTSNQQNPVFAFTQVGTPTVQLVVQSSLGCNDTIAQTINVEEGPTAAFLISENPAPINFEVDFENASDNEVAWNWDFGDGIGESDLQNPSYSYPDEGDYVVTLIVTGSSGCLDSAQTTLTISGELILPPRVPNSFSPNGDGTNDVYYVRGGPFIELDFRVYDGWGREIWSTTDQEIGWDGTEGGKQSPVGVYVYTLKATNLEGEEYDFTGRINLLR
jgi:gliding motility-associated-like protein